MARLSPRVRSALAAVSAVGLLPAAAASQMAGVPVLQGAFLRPGLALAVNGGSADDGSAVGGAVSLGLGGGRFALSAGAAAFSPPERFDSPAVTYGGRVAWNVLSFANGALGVTPFAGVGRLTVEQEAVTGASGAVETGSLRLLGGVSVGYRRALGTRGVVALFAAPTYVRAQSDSSELGSDNLARVALGAELGWTLGFGTVGVTVGIDAGSSAAADRVGPRGGGFGVGLAFARGGERR